MSRKRSREYTREEYELAKEMFWLFMSVIDEYKKKDSTRNRFGTH